MVNDIWKGNEYENYVLPEVRGAINDVLARQRVSGSGGYSSRLNLKQLTDEVLEAVEAALEETGVPSKVRGE